jgi:hypothetical protein
LTKPLSFILSIKDEDKPEWIEIRNGVLIHQPALANPKLPVISTDRQGLIALLSGTYTGVTDPTLGSFAKLFEAPKAGFGLVLPNP